MAENDKDYYAVLEVPSTASHSEIKAAFRKLALKYHPDKNNGSKIAEDKFKDVNEANTVLGDVRQRLGYDQERKKKHKATQARRAKQRSWKQRQGQRESQDAQEEVSHPQAEELRRRAQQAQQQAQRDHEAERLAREQDRQRAHKRPQHYQDQYLPHNSRGQYTRARAPSPEITKATPILRRSTSPQPKQPQQMPRCYNSKAHDPSSESTFATEPMLSMQATRDAKPYAYSSKPGLPNRYVGKKHTTLETEAVAGIEEDWSMPGYGGMPGQPELSTKQRSYAGNSAAPSSVPLDGSEQIPKFPKPQQTSTEDHMRQPPGKSTNIFSSMKWADLDFVVEPAFPPSRSQPVPTRSTHVATTASSGTAMFLQQEESIVRPEPTHTPLQQKSMSTDCISAYQMKPVPIPKRKSINASTSNNTQAQPSPYLQSIPKSRPHWQQ